MYYCQSSVIDPKITGNVGEKGGTCLKVYGSWPNFTSRKCCRPRES